MTSDDVHNQESPSSSRLEDLGYDEWFAARAADILGPDQSIARVMAVDRGSYVVRGERGETQAELSGKLRYELEASPDLPCVGDWVCVNEASPDLAIVQAVLPRRTVLRRKTPGKTVDFQMIAANIDTAFIVQSCHYDFNLRRLDRYLVVVKEGGIEPVVVLSKTDLVTAAELEEMVDSIRGAGIQAPLVPLSNETGEGQAENQHGGIHGEMDHDHGIAGMNRKHGRAQRNDELAGQRDKRHQATDDHVAKWHDPRLRFRRLR